MLAGRYELEKQVGRGESSEVWRAMDQRLMRTVAIKMTGPQDDGARDRFSQEARLLARLDHPNILPLYETGETGDGRAFMALKWIDDGLSLEDLMRDRPRFGWGEVVLLGRAVASALACAHEQDVLHRDIKPSNILIPPGGLGRAQLSDFGVLGALEEPDARLGNMTQAGVVAGTPWYMAPEQLSGQRLSARTDLYSLALVMRNMLWRPASEPPSFTMVLLERLQSSGQVPDDPAVPAGLRELLQAMLQRDPEARPGSASEVAAALGRLLSDADTGSHAVVLPTSGAPEPASIFVAPAPAAASPASGSQALPQPVGPSVAASRPGRLVVLALISLLVAATVFLLFASGSKGSTSGPSFPASSTAILEGILLMVAGVLTGLVISRAIDQRRTALEHHVSLALTGRKDRKSLSRTMILSVDAIIQQTSKLDAQFLGATIIGMVREYDEAKESSDKQQALVRATELLEKLLEKTSPWYVRNSKWVVAAASLVGLLSGASKLVGELRAILH